MMNALRGNCRRYGQRSALQAGLLAVVLSAPASAQTVLYWSQPDGIWRTDDAGLSVERVAAAFSPAGIAATESDLAWSEVQPRLPISPTGVVHHALPDGSQSMIVAHTLRAPAGIDLDPNAGVIYWSDLEDHAIYGVALDGGELPEKLLADEVGVTAIHDLALDPQRGQLYFGYVNPLIDSLFPGAIGRLQLDGTGWETIASGLVEPLALAFNPARDELYWSQIGLDGMGEIQRMDLATGSRVTVVAGLGDPSGLAFDEVGQELYWADAGLKSLGRSARDGSQIARLAWNRDVPLALAVVTVPEPATVWIVWLGIGLSAARLRRSRWVGNHLPSPR